MVEFNDLGEAVKQGWEVFERATDGTVTLRQRMTKGGYVLALFRPKKEPVA